MAASTIPQDSGYKAIRAALTARLTRNGVHVGTTAGYPRVEIHSMTEGERLDKGAGLRVISATIESMTTDSMLACNNINAKNIELLNASALDLSSYGYTFVGLLYRQLQDITESADTQNILYRLLQQVDIYITKN